ncbi:MAG: 3'-5' exonuclease [Bacteroidaceae bacterium]|nr:3'-5' exonuclease [Bacteroidales bacterium]MBP3670594.1 3'-5' exonuclease [Bacteroidaceae bacterium]MBQ2980323.1 3'-5' exonuclease [Bacteroidaceae bacterium]
MELKLVKPIVFFDLETTGTNITDDRIVELSYIKVYPDGREESRTLRINPGRPIPAEATAVHHISDADVADAPRFEQVARDLAAVFTDVDIAGFNSNRFDVPLLVEEFLRVGVNIDLSKCRFVDVQTIFHKMEQRTLSAAYLFYCGKELDGAHSADADTRATYEVLKAQLDRYNSLQNDIEFLSKFSTQNRNVDFAGRIIYNDKNVEVFNFGKYKGMPVAEVMMRDSGYYSWIMQGDFPLNTKNVITRIRLRGLNNNTHK